jgi:hypothetical protein
VKRALCLLLCACAWLSVMVTVAHARVERFALLLGNNLGAAHELPLRYAESDAQRMYDVLNQLGDFSALNITLLRGQDASTVRSGLIELNERIREKMSQPDTQTVLVVYYSGHADAQSLHLGDTQLPLTELRQLARGSSATFRLVVLDACRSGSLTRVKGAKRIPAFELEEISQPTLPNDGIAFLTASAAHEDAQESDELHSAFFTHAFVSGLHGAADRNDDGAVALDEAYRYAYDATLRATSRTFAGAQHATFQYDLRGRGQLVLTRPRAHAAGRAQLSFPAGLSFLLLRDSEDGNVVAELEREATSRTLTVEPGRYFVRARGPDVMYEGQIAATRDALATVQLAQLDRIDYARLVRARGSGQRQRVHGIEVGPTFRSALPNASTPCIGAYGSYAIDWHGLGARVRVSSCASQMQSRVLEAHVQASDLALQLYHAWDISWFTLELGLGAGLSLFHQSFATRGRAPSQLAVAPLVNLGLAAEAALSGGYYTRLGVTAETHFLPMSNRAEQPSEIDVGFVVGTSLGLGKRF